MVLVVSVGISALLWVACGISRVEPGTTKQDLSNRFGEPDLVLEKCTEVRQVKLPDGKIFQALCGENDYKGRWFGQGGPPPGAVRWRYYLSGDKYRQGRVTLDITFAPEGSATSWSFRDVDTGRAIPLQGTVRQADAWRKRNCDRTLRIDIAESIEVGKTTPEDIRSTFGLPQKTRRDQVSGADVWSYFTSAPSPLLRPPFWLDVDLDDKGVTVGSGVVSAYYGCGVL
jgi:hypothetical protein